jgi:hypothetical protein
MATSYFVKSGAGAVVLANQAWNNGDKMVPTRADATSNVNVARAWVWEVTTAGTSTGTPTWPASVTQDTTTVTQNGVVWTARKPGYSSGSTVNWAWATIFYDYGTRALGNGDTLYVSNNHAESQGDANVIGTFNTTNGNSYLILCVGDSVTSGFTLATTASVATTGTRAITCVSSVGGYRTYIYGISFTAGSGGSAAGLNPNQNGTGGASVVFESCTFVPGTTATVTIACSGGTNTKWINCNFKFNAAGQSLNCNASAVWEIIGGSLLSGGTSPTTLVSTIGHFRMLGVDLSNASGSMNIFSNTSPGNLDLVECKLPSAWSGSLSSAASGCPDCIAQMMDCDSAGTNYKFNRATGLGTIQSETTVVRTSPLGATDGTTPLSWKMVSNSSAIYPVQPLYTDWFLYGWNDVTDGSTVALSIEALMDGAIPDNSQMWTEWAYLGSSGSPIATIATTEVTNVLATPSAYSGSGNTWTTTGVGTPNAFTMSANAVPLLKGPIIARVALTKATSTVYVNPPTPGAKQFQIPGGSYINENIALPAIGSAG